MAFPTAADISYKVVKNTTFMVGMDTAGFQGVAQLGALHVDADPATANIGEGQTSTLIFQESWDSSPPKEGSPSGTGGWFDDTTFRLNTSKQTEGLGCYQYLWPAGVGGSPDGAAIRHNVEMTKEVDVTFHMLLEPTFPSDHSNHILYFVTNLDTGNGPPYTSPYPGFSSTYCSATLNAYEDTLLVEFQANRSGVGWFTPVGGQAGVVNDGKWHKIRCYFKMNSYSNGAPNSDGAFRVWLDDLLVCENTAVQMTFEIDVDPYFTQFAYGPYWSTNRTLPAVDSSMYLDDTRLNIPLSGTGTPEEPADSVAGIEGRDDPFHQPPAGMTPLYVDAANGLDSNDGSLNAPWATLQHAFSNLQPGQELRVRPTGDYIVDEDSGSGFHPSIQPTSDGTADQPIVVRGDPAYDTKPRIKRTNSTVSNALLGVRRRSHIWFMDLEVDGGLHASKGMILYYGNGCRIIRCDVHGIRNGGFDNTNAIRLEAAVRCYVYGNDLHDVRNTENTTNATGVTVYGSMDCVISHNDFYDAPCGYKDKSYGQQAAELPAGSASSGMVIEYNRFRSTTRTGASIHVQRGYDILDCHIRYNLFKSSSEAIGGSYHDEPANNDGVYGLFIHHNTLYGYGNRGMRPGIYGDNYQIHSNIFYTSENTSGVAYDVRSGAPATSFDVVGWNAFRHAAKFIVNDTDNLGTYAEAYPLDSTNLQNHAPAWADVATDDFRLASTSPLRSAGRNGTPVGAFGDASENSWAWWLAQAETGPLYDPAYDPSGITTWYWVDAANGNDANTGTEAAPWATLQHAVAQLDAAGKGLNVRPTGTYYLNNAPVNGSTNYWSPSVQPTGSGTAANPIVIRKDPAYTAKPVIRRTQHVGHYMLGVHSLNNNYGGPDHVWFIDLDVGISMPEGVETDSIFALHWTIGCRIVRCDIHHVRDSSGSNPSGVRMEHTDGCHLYGNRIWDVRSHDGSWKWNISCIKQYSTRNAKIHHNELWDSFCGYIDKNAPNFATDPRMSNTALGSELNEVYKNLIHDVEMGIVLLANGDEPAQDNTYRHNLIIAPRGIETESSKGNNEQVLRFAYHNNTVVSFSERGMSTTLLASDAKIYNNILVKTTDSSAIEDINIRGPASAVTKLANNAFRYNARVIDQNGTAVTVDATNLQNVDPLFRNAAANDYRLQSSSPLLEAGDDGLAIGAFDPGDDWRWW